MRGAPGMQRPLSGMLKGGYSTEASISMVGYCVCGRAFFGGLLVRLTPLVVLVAALTLLAMADADPLDYVVGVDPIMGMLA